MWASRAADSLRRRLCLWLCTVPLLLGLMGAAASFGMLRASATGVQLSQRGAHPATQESTRKGEGADSVNRSPIRDADVRALVELAPSLVGLLPVLVANIVIVGKCLKPLDRLQDCGAFIDNVLPDPGLRETMPVEIMPMMRTNVAAVCLQTTNLSHHAAEQREERLSELENGVRRLAASTSQLLTLANARLEPAAGQVGEVSLRRSVYTAVARALPLAVERGVDLGVTHIEDVTVLAVEDDVLTLLSNVLDIAVHQGGNDARVDVKVAQFTDLARVEVAVSGPNVSEGGIKRVFEQFLADDGYQDDNLVLGIRIAVALAERYDGRVDIHRGLDSVRTAVVCIELPASHHPSLANGA